MTSLLSGSFGLNSLILFLCVHLTKTIEANDIEYDCGGGSEEVTTNNPDWIKYERIIKDAMIANCVFEYGIVSIDSVEEINGVLRIRYTVAKCDPPGTGPSCEDTFPIKMKCVFQRARYDYLEIIKNSCGSPFFLKFGNGCGPGKTHCQV